MEDTTRWEVFKLYFEFAWHHFVSRILNISLIFWLFPTKSTKYCYLFRHLETTFITNLFTDSKFRVCLCMRKDSKNHYVICTNRSLYMRVEINWFLDDKFCYISRVRKCVSFRSAKPLDFNSGIFDEYNSQ